MFFTATLLDPRYKDCYFDKDVKSAQAILGVHLLPAAGAEDGTHNGESAYHPQCKRQQAQGEHSLYDMFEEILEENEPERSSTSVSQQLDIFVAETPIPRSERALGYWRNNHLCFQKWHKWHTNTFVHHAAAPRVSGYSALCLMSWIKKEIDFAATSRDVYLFKE